MPLEAGDLIDPDDLLGALDDLDRRVENLEGHNPWCRVSKSGPQTVPINVGTALTWDVESWDNGPLHSGSSSQLIAPITGVYTGVLYVVVADDTRGFRTILVRANGTTDLSALKHDAAGTGSEQMTIPYEGFLNAGDSLEGLFYFESSTGDPTTLDVLGASMTMRYIGQPV